MKASEIINKGKQNVMDEPRPTLSMHPKKFALWLFIVSVVMIFAALTSAYIVRKSQGDWILIHLPDILWFSTGVIFVSSIFMHLAFIAAKKDNFALLKMSLLVTSILGITFLISQFQSWVALVEQNNYFTGGHVASSFLYVFTGLHGLHLVSAVIFLLVTLVNGFKYKIHSKKLNQIEMCATYWHFLDGLWIYLFLFLLFNQ